MELGNEKSADYSLWKVPKRTNKSITQILPLKTPTNQWARSNFEKADIYLEHLVTTFSLNDTSANSLLPLNNSIENDVIALTTT